MQMEASQGRGLGTTHFLFPSLISGLPEGSWVVGAVPCWAEPAVFVSSGLVSMGTGVPSH